MLSVLYAECLYGVSFMLSVTNKPFMLSVLMLVKHLSCKCCCFFVVASSYKWQHDTQHNDIQLNDTQHNGLICDSQHKRYSALKTLSIKIMSAVMLSVVMLSVVAPF